MALTFFKWLLQHKMHNTLILIWLRSRSVIKISYTVFLSLSLLMHRLDMLINMYCSLWRCFWMWSCELFILLPHCKVHIDIHHLYPFEDKYHSQREWESDVLLTTGWNEPALLMASPHLSSLTFPEMKANPRHLDYMHTQKHIQTLMHTLRSVTGRGWGR